MSTLDDNRALVHRLIEIVNAGDLDALAGVATGQVAREAARWIGPFRASFPDFHMEVIDVIAEHDKVVGHFRCSGTHEGEWRGHAPTGRRFAEIDEIYIFALDGGKLTTATAVVEDNLTRLRQLGLQSPE
ncbi:MAG: ester cyclase [Actinomycetota bacterium]|nr:ester cyclase [Actinomycetota bacterium]